MKHVGSLLIALILGGAIIIATQWKTRSKENAAIVQATKDKAVTCAVICTPNPVEAVGEDSCTCDMTRIIRGVK